MDDIQVLADVIKDVLSHETPPPRYLATKQRDIHIFSWPCRCWIKFKGPEALPEGAKLDDTWELSWAMGWTWLEEGSCSIAHGSDGRALVSPINGQIIRERIVIPGSKAPIPIRPGEGPLTRRDLLAEHDAAVTKLIDAHLKENEPGEEGT